MTEYTELFKITFTDNLSKAEDIEEFLSAVQEINNIYGVLDIATPKVSAETIPMEYFNIDITYDTHLTDRTVLAQNIEELDFFEEVIFA